MENVKTIVLKGTEEVVSIIGLNGEGTMNDIIIMQVVEALNENYILEDLVSDGVVEVELTDDCEYCTVGGNEYRVVEGEESAQELAKEYTKEVFCDCGMSNELLEIADQQGCIDTDWFEDAWKELHESQAWEEGIEYIATEEEMEQLEEGVITEDEIRQNYEDGLNASIEGQWMEEFKFQFGDEYFNEMVKKNELIDLDKLAEYCVDCDGRGHSLAHYDGVEIQEGELFLYRTN